LVKNIISVASLRERHNLSVGKLSSIMGFSKGYISRIESGKENPSNKFLFVLGKVLDESYDIRCSLHREYGKLEPKIKKLALELQSKALLELLSLLKGILKDVRDVKRD